MNLKNRVASLRVAGFYALVSLAAGLGAIPAPAYSAVPGTVDLIATPPGLTTSVSPNLVITLDDSGSMGRNYMPDSRPYGGGGWGATDQQSEASSQSYNSGGGPYLCAGIIDPRVTDPTNPRSRAMNGVYYNPNATYRPPLLKNGVSQMPNATFGAAWDNGIQVNRPDSATASTTRNLAAGTRFCGNAAGYYRLKTGIALPVDADDKFTPVAVTNIYTSGNWEWVSLPVAERQNFANWYSYYHTRHLAAKSALSRAYAPFDESIRVAWQNINANKINSNTKIYKFKDLPSTNNVRTKFYDWLFATPVSGNTPSQPATVRVGEFFKRATGNADTNPYWDRDINRELSCRQNFHINMSDGFWNGSVAPPTVTDTSPANQTLPDGETYSTSDAQSKIFWNENSAAQNTLADIAFYYWRTDLRSDFMSDPDTALKVPSYLPDRSTSMFGPPLVTGENPRLNKEIYWNPANDPAIWPHLVQFMIGFGISGTISQSDVAYEQLRRGNIAWPKLDGTGTYTDNEKKMDDTWHAAINSRGKFFAASNPEELISALTEIISSIVARRGASTAMSVSLPLITDGTTGYTAGYDTTDWSGYLVRNRLDPISGESIGVEWDASCILTGGPCPSVPLAPAGTARDPNSRIIITSDGLPSTGKPFRWSSLSAAQKAQMSVDPVSLRLDLAPPVINADAHGEKRVDYIRGDRTYETTAVPHFRQRSSVMGAVIKGEPEYVSSPVTGHRDIFPAGSPEADAYLTQSYARFQFDNRDRLPTVYVAANDGTLHAFNAASGAERWAYVPNILINNFNLVKSTRSDAGLVATLDDKPQQFDAFINGSWRTILVGSMRLGGRGIYALDVSNPAQLSETNASVLPMWEFSNVDPAGGAGLGCTEGDRFCTSLGYTYDSVNFARIKYGNKWVALVSSGYFPINSLDPASTDTAAERTSLLVIDLETGQLIREIKTVDAPQSRPGGFRTFGLSTPVTYDFGSNQIDDIAVAGDLAGNLWRFDFSNADPDQWKVDLMFTNYGAGEGGTPNVGDQPFSFNPTALRDPMTRGPIFIIGTGKYIGLVDRTSSIEEQAYYGIRDYGTASVNYPIRVNQLVDQSITQDASGVRRMAVTNPVEEINRGWRLPLDIDTEPGERAERRAFPLFSSNRAILYTLIPKGEDPCNPGARYGIMVVDGATGSKSNEYGSGLDVVGAALSSGSPPSNPVTDVGGGGIRIIGLPPGLPPEVGDAFNDEDGPLADDVWHRGAWRELIDVR